jgi:hypothetical protein
MSEAARGKAKSESHRAAITAAQLAQPRTECELCGRTITVRHFSYHLRTQHA